MKTTVIIVRHGQSTSNAKRVIQGHHDVATLTELGQQQARTVGNTLASLTLDAIYASPLKRARHTCELIVETMRSAESAQQLPDITITDRLKEINLPLWESRTFDDVEATYPDMYTAWRHQPNEFKMPLPNDDGTTTDFYPVREIWERAAGFWQ
ncbi:MAG: histidine phosphatase family protein, partial [Cyanobacteria bacterium J06614_10]